MASKGPSNRYQTGSRSSNGKTISHTNFEWARDFNKKSLNKHFDDHAKSMGFTSKESYKQHAIKFANTIDKKNNVSFIDSKTGATYKYSKTSSEFAIITKDGYVSTYFKPKDGYSYYKKQLSLNKKNKRGTKK